MRQAKRVFYIVLLNVIISAITVGVVLQLWENDHPLKSADQTPQVIVVTATQSVNLPFVGNNFGSVTGMPDSTQLPISGTVQLKPTLEMITYQVKEGDILGNLAVQFNVRIADILAVNNLTDPDSLYVGQIIHIPTGPLPTATPNAPAPTIIATVTPRPSATSTQRIAPSSTPTLIGQAAHILVDTVIGAGVLENEHVVLRRTGDGELSMAGWRLTDGNGNEYFFPQLTLYKDGAINLNTRGGQNTVADLFWGLTSPIWRPGKIISIYDAQNILRATYTIP